MQALAFDLDDTLVVEVASAQAAFLETCEVAQARHGIEPEALTQSVRDTCRGLWYDESPDRPYCVAIGVSSWEAMWARFEGEDPRLATVREWAPKYRLEAWERALRRHHVEDSALAAELAEGFIANRRKRHVLFDDALSALEAFRRAYRLGLLTNGTPDLQWTKIRGAGIADYFDAIVISGEVGVKKPYTPVFEAMLSRFGVKPEEAVMVGNGLESDVKGAQDAGMMAVWLNREGNPREDSVVPDAEIRTLAELSQVLPSA